MAEPQAAGAGNEKGDALLIPLSALQHYLYCPRQCALIHVERAWAENARTAEGRLLHAKTEKPAAARRGDMRVVHGLPLHSARLGLSGLADVVEFHARAGGGEDIFPVEFKRGRPKSHRADEVQLCAQALCLEDMFGAVIAKGALFYGESRRRQEVAIDDPLRNLTLEILAATRTMIAAGQTPAPIYDKRKCGGCSLLDLCGPQVPGRAGSVDAWLARKIEEE
jgi:CRISPR-associated exonuclease Cas4